MSRVLPSTPSIDRIIEEKGSDYLFSTFFEDGYNAKPDAPDDVKSEAAILQEFFEKNGPWKRAEG